ncbi:unnamed protein product [Dovyalis caffra]|uniref:Uncharacterized protein n=1 Tax=Dovyalis caffra TaxID=77055 RepID=A0AAV1R887_9ROSI|nr:unnamed protein product [Dovyalis caffra]
MEDSSSFDVNKIATRLRSRKSQGLGREHALSFLLRRQLAHTVFDTHKQLCGEDLISMVFEEGRVEKESGTYKREFKERKSEEERVDLYGCFGHVWKE